MRDKTGGWHKEIGHIWDRRKEIRRDVSIGGKWTARLQRQFVQHFKCGINACWGEKYSLFVKLAVLLFDCQKAPQKTLCRDRGQEKLKEGVVWRVVHSVVCWPSHLWQGGGKKEAQRIETKIIMGMERSPAVVDAQFKKEANKIIESVKVPGIPKWEQLHQETSWELRFGISEQ